MVLITKEKETILKGVLQGSQKYNKPVDFAIKHQIEELNLDESQQSSYISPIIIVTLENITKIFKALDLEEVKAFIFFC